LREGAGHVEEHPAGRGRGVDGLLMEEQIDVCGLKLMQGVHQVSQ
jgi:hypothetical protein